MLIKIKIVSILTLIVLLGSTSVYSANEGQILGGSINSPIRIEVFSDFQCPACRDFYLGTIRQVLQNYSQSNKVCVLYHEFPLNIHKYAKTAARYGEAASRMGLQNLLMVYDTLYANQAQWSQNGNIEAVLAKALAPKEFQTIKTLVKDPNIDQVIKKETDLANKQNIKSTPTVILHYAGKQERVESGISYLLMKQFIDSKLK
jgi:protein-disulfide isomerase